MATRNEDHFQVSRITYHIPKSFNDVVNRLKSSIGNAPPNPPSPVSITSKESFEAAISARLGPHNFMQFHEIDHGSWMGFYGVHTGKAALRIIYGNPNIAITMLRHDVRAGLFAPVEALVVEREDGKGTDVVYIQPSTLVAGAAGSGEELKAAAVKLDQSLEKLWDWVAKEE